MHQASGETCERYIEEPVSFNTSGGSLGVLESLYKWKEWIQLQIAFVFVRVSPPVVAGGTTGGTWDFILEILFNNT